MTWVFGHLFSLADIEYYNPFSLKKNMWIVNWDRASYSVELSILHHFVYQLNRCLSNVFTLDNINFSNNESSDIQKFMICGGG